MDASEPSKPSPIPTVPAGKLLKLAWGWLLACFLANHVLASVTIGPYSGLAEFALAGLAVGQVAVLATVAVFGPGHWLWRQTGVMVAMFWLLLAATDHIAWRHDRYDPFWNPWQYHWFLPFFVAAPAMQLPLWVFRYFSGYRMQAAHCKQDDSWRRFQIADLLLLTGIVAAALIFVRWAADSASIGTRFFLEVALLAGVSTAGGILLVPWVWLLLSDSPNRRSRSKRLGVLLGTVGLWAAACLLIYYWTLPYPDVEFVLMPAAAYGLTLGTFAAVRRTAPRQGALQFEISHFASQPTQTARPLPIVPWLVACAVINIYLGTAFTQFDDPWGRVAFGLLLGQMTVTAIWTVYVSGYWLTRVLLALATYIGLVAVFLLGGNPFIARGVWIESHLVIHPLLAWIGAVAVLQVHRRFTGLRAPSSLATTHPLLNRRLSVGHLLGLVAVIAIFAAAIRADILVISRFASDWAGATLSLLGFIPFYGTWNALVLLPYTMFMLRPSRTSWRSAMVTVPLAITVGTFVLAVQFEYQPPIVELIVYGIVLHVSLHVMRQRGFLLVEQ